MALIGSKSKKRLTVLTALGGVAGLFIFGLSLSVSPTEESLARIDLSRFGKEAELSYQVFQDGKIVEKGQKSLKGDESLTLDASPYLRDLPQSTLSYKLSINKNDAGNISDPLDLLVKMDGSTGRVDYSAAGLGQFSDVLVSDGDSPIRSKADWNGGFAGEKIFDRLDEKNKGLLKLAFQGHDLGKDVLPREEGVVEVFFGDSSGSSVGAVQTRWTRALAMMTEQLSAVMMQQAEIVGAFFDAKFQLESQRKTQELVARAHKDYHPSEQICRFGTFVKSLAHSERAMELDMRALNRELLNQMLSSDTNSSSTGPSDEFRTRLDQFRTKYCNPRDNNNSLDLMCPTLVTPTPAQAARFNKDIDYFRTIDGKLTIEANFADATISNEEEDVFALAKNLYFTEVFPVPATDDMDKSIRTHYNSRAHAAKIAAAQNSFVNIVGMKSSAPAGAATPAVPSWPPNIVAPPVVTYTEDTGWTFMKAFIRELGVGLTDPEIHAFLGERPSYYAQMDVLTKKIYESPTFYTNLYDKPVNVDRIGAAIDAIALMNMRDRFDSSLRREMLTSLLVEHALQPSVENVSSEIFKAIQDEPATLQ